MANLIFKGEEKAVNFGQLANEIANRKTRSAWTRRANVRTLELKQVQKNSHALYYMKKNLPMLSQLQSRKRAKL